MPNQFTNSNPLDRFVKNYEIVGDCWEWTAYKDKNGYGKFKYLGETRAHRVSYLIFNGELPKNLYVCHTCDNPSCINPEHLFLGTQQDNTDDAVAK